VRRPIAKGPHHQLGSLRRFLGWKRASWRDRPTSRATRRTSPEGSGDHWEGSNSKFAISR